MESNADDVAGELASTGNAISSAVQTALYRAGLLLQAAIQRNASGRPGPISTNPPNTGDYRRSWTTERLPDGGVAVGTNLVQGPRLEFGFVGADSLRRVYNQPPYPHVEPAVVSTEEPIDRVLADAVDRLLGP